MPDRTLFDLIENTPQPPPPGSGVSYALALASLSTLPGLGSKSLKRLSVACNGDLGLLFKLPIEELLGRCSGLRIPNLDRLLQVIGTQANQLLDAGGKRQAEWGKRSVTLIPPSELPDRLRGANPDPPQWLFVQGDHSLLFRRPAVAVVGTREPTEDGLLATQVVVRYLAVYPVTIVSGLAEGIDDQAHRTALDFNLPNVAFLGHGINVVFPQKTADTRDRILRQGGLVASEYLPDDHYQKSMFVERNRLQAALADLVIPVEAKVSGGTAHTVRYAHQYKRVVMGVRFREANGLIDTIKAAGGLVFDMTSREGETLVDRAVRRLVEGSGGDSYPFKQVEESLVRMIQDREPNAEHVERLLKNIAARLLRE